MKMKKGIRSMGREVSWSFECLGLSYCPSPNLLPILPSPKHSCFHSACQRIKHMEFAAYYHIDILPQAQSSVKVQSLLEERT